MTNAAAKTVGPITVDAAASFAPGDVLKRAQALTHTLPEKNSPVCTGTVTLGVFFDGTGNNRDADLPRHKQSNVVRLWMAHKDNSQDGASKSTYYRPEYIPGVGTPFPLLGETRDQTLLQKLGNAGAMGGRARIFWGLIQTINAMHRFVLKTPLISDAEAGAMAVALSSASLLSDGAISRLQPRIKELAAVLASEKPKVTAFTISVFGFSRGAAQARAFCNFFYELCAGSTFAGVPVSISFLGIFDTVASVGLIGLDILDIDGHQTWASRLRIHPSIKKCVHFVASHEVRAAFPLDSVRYKDAYPANCTETVYPGAHSNVGGGYLPKTQARAPLPDQPDRYGFLALIPAINMYRDALLAGVPLKTFAQMRESERRNFTPTEELVADFNAYVAAEPSAGATEDILRKHMDRYRFYRFRKLDTFVEDAKKRGAPQADADFLQVTNEHYRHQCKELQRKHANAHREAEKARNLAASPWGTTRNPERPNELKSLEQHYIKHEVIPQDLEIWQSMHRSGETPAALTKLFDLYVNDSMAGFAQDGIDEFAYNGRGLMRDREVYDRGGE